MKNYFFLIGFVLFLAGCATSKPTFAPDGSQAHSIDCSGGALNWGMCYEKAGQLCKEKGYKVVAGGTDQGGTLVANQYGLYGGSYATRSLVITCNS